MGLSQAQIMVRLQKEILSLQGFKSTTGESRVDIGLGTIDQSFPNNVFPLGAVHEFIGDGLEGMSAATGFVAGITSTIMRKGGASIWISSGQNVFPPALKLYGIDPDKIIFVDIHKEKDILWAMEEALKCEGLATVIAELRELSFVASRRLQLAVENSRVTGFILRGTPRYLHTTASVCRWKIDPLPSLLEENMPGVGYPRWKVELMKVRNGKPGCWQVEWRAENFHLLPLGIAPLLSERKRKTG